MLSLVGVRLGPFKVSVGGLLQPINDAGKLFGKEVNSLSNISFVGYYLSSFLIIFFSLFLLLILSSDSWCLGVKFGVLILLIVLGLNRFRSILRGWRGFRKYSLLGRLRTVSQLISYELLLYLVFFFFLILYGSFDLRRLVGEEAPLLRLCLPVVFSIWVVSVLAELNRTPYDFSEGERELVRGFNIEFGSSAFTLIFLAEYGSIFFFIALSSLLFMACLPLGLFFFLLVLWIRSVLPRYRFDKLLALSWKVLLPECGFLLLLFFSLNY